MKSLAIKFLTWHTRTNIKRSSSVKKGNIAFSQSKKIAIIFSAEDIFKHEAIKHFVSLLEEEKKEVTVLSYLPISAENFEFRFDYVDLTALTSLGKIKSESVDKFVNTKFDFVFHMDKENDNPIIENILSQCKALCRVGLYKEGKEALYELMLKPDPEKDMKSIVDEVYYYTKELN